MIAITSVASSLFASPLLPDQVRIRWHVGTYEQWGPQYVSAELALVTFPALILVGYLGSRSLKGSISKSLDMDLYEVAVFLSLGTLLCVQLLVIGLNVVMA